MALGSRTLADLIAPGWVEIMRDHLRLDGQYARVLALTAYPRLVMPGWLSALVATDLPIELSLHVPPLASALHATRETCKVTDANCASQSENW